MSVLLPPAGRSAFVADKYLFFSLKINHSFFLSPTRPAYLYYNNLAPRRRPLHFSGKGMGPEMNRGQYKEATARLEKVTGKLRYETLSQEERERLEREGKELARIIVSPWIPFGWGYRMIMAILAGIGLLGIVQENYLFLLAWLLLPLFSPRVVGKVVGAISGFKDL